MKWQAAASAAFALTLLCAGCGASNSSAGDAPIGAKAPITFGQTNPKTGSSALLGTSETPGTDAYFKLTNAKGGVQGHQLELKSLDDNYSPTQALVDAKQLINQDKVFAFVGPNGTPQTTAVLSVAKPANVPVVGPQTGGEDLENTLDPNVFYTFPKYSADGSTLGKFAQAPGNHIDLSHVGVLYQNDSFGKSILSGLLDSGVKPVSQLGYDASQSDFSPLAAQFKGAGVTTLFLFSLVGPTVSFLHSLSSVGITPTLLLDSTSASGDSIEASGPIIQGAYISAFIPPLTDLSNPQVAEFVNAMKKYEPGQPINAYAAWGWLSAQVAVTALEKLKGDITRTAYIDALNTLSMTTIGGPLAYTKTDHTGLKQQQVLKISGTHRVKTGS